MRSLLRSFGFSLVVTLLAFGYVWLARGVAGGLTVLVLAVIELAFSFDNAIINAKVLSGLSPLWRALFLSVGILIAIFGVRALLPMVIVSAAATMPLGSVINLALHHPAQYAQALHGAQPAITAFGGAFLLMLSWQFFMAEREVRWFRYLEVPLARLRRWWLPLVLTAGAITVVGLLPANHHRAATVVAGLAGLATYSLLEALIGLMNHFFAPQASARGSRVGWAALVTFLYLELLDASLSFDGVIGAFAITSSVVLIAIGLGIGAVWVRSLTVYLVRRRTLETYRYLEHGAHYAILVLGVAMLTAPIVEVPNFVTGVVALGLIVSAVIASRQAVLREG